MAGLGRSSHSKLVIGLNEKCPSCEGRLDVPDDDLQSGWVVIYSVDSIFKDNEKCPSGEGQLEARGVMSTGRLLSDRRWMRCHLDGFGARECLK